MGATELSPESLNLPAQPPQQDGTKIRGWGLQPHPDKVGDRQDPGTPTDCPLGWFPEGRRSEYTGPGLRTTQDGAIWGCCCPSWGWWASCSTRGVLGW